MLSNAQKKYLEAITYDFIARKKHNKTSYEKLAQQSGINSQTQTKELTELALVNIARQYAHTPGLSISERYFKIVDFYKFQPNISLRTSQSMLLQQYSTPAPISFLAGIAAGLNIVTNKVFEPSAGNGLLTIAANPEQCDVNEIDENRNNNLQTQPFKSVTSLDATQPFEKIKFYDSVITNPPFGRLNFNAQVGNFTIKDLDHWMCINALKTMKDNGKASLIIGGNTDYDNEGRIKAGKNRIFLSYLYSHYNVIDLVNIERGLYSRQGTSFPVRLIIIDGRKLKPEGFAPLFNEITDAPIKSFEDLWDRFSWVENNNTLSLRAKALAMELDLLDL